jgi:TrmH family RNA methyltransferase
MLITSRHNNQIKELRRLFNRRERASTGLFFAEGVQLVAEAIEMKAEIETLIIAPELLDEQKDRRVARILANRTIPRLEVTGEVLNSISPKDGHRGIAAVVKQKWESLDHVELHRRPGQDVGGGVREPRQAGFTKPAPTASTEDGQRQELCWVAVNRIQHPGSLGTIIRVSDSVGGAGVILIGDSTDPYDPTAVRASLGAIFSQRIVRTSFEEFAAWKMRQEAFVVGTSPTATQNYREVKYTPPIILYMGSERIGLTPEEQAVCDVMVKIPMAGRIESHHVAVATAIVLYEVLNQNRR